MNAPQANKPVDTQPVSPQTTPPDTNSWQQERDSVHVWGELNKVNQTLGELKAGIAELKGSSESLKTDISGFKTQLSRVTWGATVAGAIFGGIFWFATQIWDSVLKPGLAHAVAEQVGPIIDKRVKEAMAEAAARPQQPQRGK